MSRKELVELAKSQLGPLFKTSDEQVISNIGDTVIDEAIIMSNRSETEETLKDLKATIVQCIVIAYENRGTEGVKSQGELGQSNSYIDWMEYLENNIIKKGKRFLV